MQCWGVCVMLCITTAQEGNEMIVYKVDILQELAKKGYSTTRLKRDKLISGGTIARLRAGESISVNTLNDVCLMLRCQISDIIEIIPTDEEKIKYF